MDIILQVIRRFTGKTALVVKWFSITTVLPPTIWGAWNHSILHVVGEGPQHIQHVRFDIPIQLCTLLPDHPVRWQSAFGCLDSARVHGARVSCVQDFFGLQQDVQHEGKGGELCWSRIESTVVRVAPRVVLRCPPWWMHQTVAPVDGEGN